MTNTTGTWNIHGGSEYSYLGVVHMEGADWKRPQNLEGLFKCQKKYFYLKEDKKAYELDS